MGVIAAGAGLGHLQTTARGQGRPDIVSSIIHGAVAPLARPLANGLDVTRDFSSGVLRARSLAEQNRALKAQVAALALYGDRVDQLNQEIASLREELQLKPSPGREAVNASVVGFSQTEGLLTIDEGANRGIQPNMPVVNSEGLVGLVYTVSKNECQVALLTTFGVKIGGLDISRKPPETGLVNGGGSSTLSMKMFNPKAPVASGDLIYTGGISKHIPGNIAIGRVISVEDDPDYGTIRATINPAVNLGTLREVQILK